MSRPWMPLYVADYLADTRRLSMAEHGAYMLLIMEYWRNGGLPNDERKLARIVGAGAEEWASVRDNVAELFQDGWRHKRIDAELAKSKEKSQAARASAEKRWQSERNARRNADAMRSHYDRNADADANAMLSQPQPQSSSLRSEDEPRDKRASVAKEAAAAFERFWEAWPNKVAKRDAAKAFLKVADEIDAILDGISRYKSEKPLDRAWMHPSTFLNGRRWEDHPAPTPTARAGPAHRDNRNGVGNLLAEAYGLNGHEENHPPAIRALPVPGDGEREPDCSDGGGVSRNAAELLIVGSVRRL